uniref:Uncharacterized protein n=1 Tax=Acrobeloides nanus TaxID=290746 RepID=A0A914DGR4_9BILA
MSESSLLDYLPSDNIPSLFNSSNNRQSPSPNVSTDGIGIESLANLSGLEGYENLVTNTDKNSETSGDNEHEESTTTDIDQNNLIVDVEGNRDIEGSWTERYLQQVQILNQHESSSMRSIFASATSGVKVEIQKMEVDSLELIQLKLENEYLKKMLIETKQIYEAKLKRVQNLSESTAKLSITRSIQK